MRKYLLFLLLSFLPFLEAAESKKICLNMIVKNEKDVIERCLESVKPLIDYWVIIDTGSTDGTQNIITETLKDIPGELHQSNWINFEHNRNEALNYAKNKAEYILFIDADEIFSYPTDFRLNHLDKDFYFIMTDFSGMQYARIGLVRNELDCKWVGVLHEVIDTSKAKTNGTLTQIKNIVHTDGARSKDPQKFQKDAQILEEALEKEPNNTRNVFYLAQSYKDAQDYEKALCYYNKRAAMGGWDQEVFWSLFQIGILQEMLKKPAEVVTSSYYKAYVIRPTRAEPLYRLANYYRLNGDYFSGYLVAKQGLTIPVPDDILFVERWNYDYGMLLEYSVCSYWLEKYQEALLASYLLLGKKLPENVRQCVVNNLGWIDSKIKEQASKQCALIPQK